MCLLPIHTLVTTLCIDKLKAVLLPLFFFSFFDTVHWLRYWTNGKETDGVSRAKLFSRALRISFQKSKALMDSRIYSVKRCCQVVDLFKEDFHVILLV